MPLSGEVKSSNASKWKIQFHHRLLCILCNIRIPWDHNYFILRPSWPKEKTFSWLWFPLHFYASWRKALCFLLLTTISLIFCILSTSSFNLRSQFLDSLWQIVNFLVQPCHISVMHRLQHKICFQTLIQHLLDNILMREIYGNQLLL